MSVENVDYRTLTLDNGLKVYLMDRPCATVYGELRVFHGGLQEKLGEEGYQIRMLTNIFGGNGMSSQLFKILSQEKGLAYNISAGYDGEDNKGVMYVNGGIDSSRIDEAVDAVFDSMDYFKSNLVSDRDLEKIKRSAIYEIAKMMETNHGLVGLIQNKVDDDLTPESYMVSLDAVTPQQIMDAANKYFPKSREEGKYVLLIRDPLKESQ